MVTASPGIMKLTMKKANSSFFPLNSKVEKLNAAMELIRQAKGI